MSRSIILFRTTTLLAALGLAAVVILPAIEAMASVTITHNNSVYNAAGSSKDDIVGVTHPFVGTSFVSDADGASQVDIAYGANRLGLDFSMTRGPLAAIAGFQGDVQFSVDSDVGYTMEGNFSVDVGNNCGAYIQTEMDGAWTFGNWHQVIGETTTQIDIANGLHELYPPQGQLSGIFLAGEIHGLYFRAELFSPVGCSGTSVDTGTGGLAVTFYENPYGCGDGYVAGTNECDDGNSTNGDGCDDMCKIETGFSCLGAHSSCDGILGDGLIRGNEQCDDGALIPGDGCEPNGMIESGASCTGEPSICSFLVPAMTERARLVLLVLFVVSTLVVRFNRREI